MADVTGVGAAARRATAGLLAVVRVLPGVGGGQRPPLWAIALALLVGAIAVACAVSAGSGGPSSGSDVVRQGKNLYAQHCASCHGTTGERLPIAPLNAKNFLDTRGDGTLMAVIAEGKGVMPAFGTGRGGPLSTDDVRSVVAFLNQQAGRTSASILADAGAKLYTEQCATCHGPNGDRIPISPLNAKGFLDTRTDTALKQAIATGKGPMPPFGRQNGGRLGDADLDALVGYLRFRVEERTAQTASRGRDLYLGNCLQCHGVSGDQIPGIRLSSASYLESLGDGAILISINDGKGFMPAFGAGSGGAMGVPDIAALLTYMKTWAGLNSTAALATAGMQGQGQELFLRNCTGCHGKGGDGVPGIKLLSKEFLSRETDSVLLQTITRGNAKGMPAWGVEAGGPLTAAQIQSILDYLKSSAVSDGVSSPGPGQAIPGSGQGSGGSGSSVVVPITAEAVANGKEIFMGTCAMCHGETRDKVPTCRLTDPAFFQERGDETLIQSITFGKGAMPSWGNVKGGPLSPDDVKDVLAFLKNEAGVGEIDASAPPSSGGQSATADLVAKGKSLFMGTCAMCHGETRDKVPTCKLADPSWLEAKTFDGVVAAITNGKPPMMPTWGKSKGGSLEDDEILAIATFLWEEAGLGGASGGGGSGGSAAAPPADAQGFSAALVDQGKTIFMGTCTMCHGETRDKVPTCKLADPGWLQEKTFDGIVAAITNGKPPMMPTWGKSKGGSLDDEQIRAVASFLWAEAGLGKAP